MAVDSTRRIRSGRQGSAGEVVVITTIAVVAGTVSMLASSQLLGIGCRVIAEAVSVSAMPGFGHG